MAASSPRPDRWTRTQVIAAVIASITGVIGIVVSVVIAQGWIGKDESDSVERAVDKALRNHDAQQVSDPPPSTKLASSTTTHAPTAVAEKVRLGVVNHCFCSGPRGQAQIKLKPSVTNESREVLPLAAQNLRLLVAEPLPGDWTPPAPAGEIVKVRVGDRTVLAIPPNPGGAAERTGSGLTFATHWDQSSVNPGARYLDERVKRGDLVYYLPRRADGSIVVLGLGHVTQRSSGEWKLNGFIDSKDWLGEADPNDF